MQYLLSPHSHSTLTRLAHERVLCGFDFDGTLAPIVDHPDQARMRERTRLLLERLATLYPCVILSGRSRADVLNKLGGLAVERVIGNHGAEVDGTAFRVRQYIETWKVALIKKIQSLPGLWVEDKGFSLAVHYRQSPRKAEARRHVLKAAQDLEHVRVFGGKQVVNLVLDSAPGKGDALASERDRLNCTWVLFVGDDQNDEDAFALDGKIIAVRVGRNQRSRARYYLRSQAEIDKLLEVLISLRTASEAGNRFAHELSLSR
jgi:trehalose 6-phosphate phosphatase